MRRLGTALAGGMAVVFCLGGEAALSYLHPEQSAAPTLASITFRQSAPDPRSHSSTSTRLQNNRVSRLLGQRVENKDGQFLGRLKDFVIDLPASGVQYALLSSGGFLGLGARVRAVPAQMVSTATAKRGVLELDVTLIRWRRAPVLKSENLALLNDSHYAQQIAAFYGQVAQNALARGPAAPAESPSPLEPTGRGNGGSSVASQGASGLALATDLIGAEVINRQQADLGEISDLLIELSGRRPVLALLSAGKLLNRDGRFAVSLRWLRPAADDTLALDANRRMFEQAPPLDPQTWQASALSGVTEIYRYTEGRPHGIRRNAGGKPEGQLQAQLQLTLLRKEHYGQN